MKIHIPLTIHLEFDLRVWGIGVHMISDAQGVGACLVIGPFSFIVERRK